QAQLTASGALSQDGLQLSLQPASQVQAAQLTWLDAKQPVTARQLQLKLGGLQWASDLDAKQTLHIPLDLQLGVLEHSTLRSQGWYWRGSVQRDNLLALDGALSNDAGLTMRTRVRQGSDGFMLDGELDELNFARG